MYEPVLLFHSLLGIAWLSNVLFAAKTGQQAKATLKKMPFPSSSPFRSRAKAQRSRALTDLGRFAKHHIESLSFTVFFLCLYCQQGGISYQLPLSTQSIGCSPQQLCVVLSGSILGTMSKSDVGQISPTRKERTKPNLYYTDLALCTFPITDTGTSTRHRMDEPQAHIQGIASRPGATKNSQNVENGRKRK